MYINNIKIWNREFELEVIFSGYPEEQITDEQKNSYEKLLGSAEEIEKSLSYVKKYVCEKSNNSIVETDVDNIFKYVMPRYIYVSKTKRQCVAIMCDYRFDIENGIAVVFVDGKYKDIGSQDIVL